MKPQKPKEQKVLEKRGWRLVVFLVVLALASLFFQYVIEAPINLPDSFLALPVMSLWQPLFGLPLLAFSVWWILDRRIPLLVLVIPLILTAYCGRLLVGSPPDTLEEGREALLEMMSEEERRQFIQTKNPPRYKRSFFPPFRTGGD